jgi:hypothetical protein
LLNLRRSQLADVLAQRAITLKLNFVEPLIGSRLMWKILTFISAAPNVGGEPAL